MSLIRIQGGTPLCGEVSVQGSKNAALPLMAASLLVPGVTILENCPHITDVSCMCKILQAVGVRVEREGAALRIDASALQKCMLPAEYVTRMRSSVILLGSLLGRLGEASLHYPGGCVIGDRPIDLHIKALRQMGAVLTENDGWLQAKAERLQGAVVILPFPSVGATETAVLAAVLAEGTTHIYRSAREPEVRQLCDFLNGAGARVTGGGSSHITVEGVTCLQESSFLIEADRIVAGTYAIGVLAAGGEAFLRDAPAQQMESLLEVAGYMGLQAKPAADGLFVKRTGKLLSPGYLETDVYPGFPTDLQSQMLVALCRAEGSCSLTERIFNGRFGVVEELKRMGAQISVEKDRAVTEGESCLHAASVTAKELRGGAALVLAGACSQGITCVCNRKFIDRGYEDICRDLKKLGVRIDG